LQYLARSILLLNYYLLLLLNRLKLLMSILQLGNSSLLQCPLVLSTGLNVKTYENLTKRGQTTFYRQRVCWIVNVVHQALLVWVYKFSPNMVHYTDRTIFSKSSLYGFNITYVFYQVRWPNCAHTNMINVKKLQFIHMLTATYDRSSHIKNSKNKVILL